MTTPLRILVTGSRQTTLEDDRHVWATLDRICAPVLAAGRSVVIVQGECHKGGVDLAARRWAEATPGVENEGHPADWNTHGKAAGMIRNGAMVALGAELCVAFPMLGSRGTWDCLKKAAEAGIVGRVYPIG